MGQSTDPKIILSKLESVAGTDAVPTALLDAILIEDDVQFTHEVMKIDRNNAKAYFGRDQKLVYGKKLTLRFNVEQAGAGAAGTVPKYGTLLKSCGFAENVLAAAHANTAQAGALGSITLAAGASGADNTYRYMQLRITGGTGAGQMRVCKSYVGATKVFTPYKPFTVAPDATSIYSIDAQVVWNPTGTCTSNTKYFYYSGKIHKLLMARGSVAGSQKSGEKRKFIFTVTGLYGGIVDSGAFPDVVLNGWVEPVVVNFANTAKSELHGLSSYCYDFQWDIGNKIVYRNLPGVEDTLFTDREPTGNIEIEDPLIAQKDFPAIVNAGTLGDLLTQHGTVAGNIVGEYLPNVGLDAPTTGDQDGQCSLKFTLDISPTYGTGNDEILIYAK